MAAQQEFRKLKKKLEGAIDRLPAIIMNVAATHFLQENFDKQQYDGIPWQPRKPRGHYRKDGSFIAAKNKRQSDNRAVLVKSGALRRSILTNNRILGNKIIISVLPYGEYHNEGVDKIPQRRFIGVDSKLKRKIDKSVDEVLRNISY